MNIEAKVGGNRRKKDPRDCRNWVGSLTLKASREGDQFIMAAIYRIVAGLPRDSEAARRCEKALTEYGKECLRDHKQREAACGIRAVLK